MNERFLKLTVFLAVLGVAVAGVWVWFVDGSQILPRLLQAHAVLVLPALALTGLCLFLRFVRWQFLLRRVGIRVPTRPGLSIFLASLVGIATPAYAGEILRSVLLRRRFGSPIRVTAFVLLVERLLDFAALTLLAAVTSTTASARILVLLVVAAAILVGLAAARLAPGFGTPMRVLKQLGEGRTLAQAFTLSLIAWVPASLLVSLAALSLGSEIPPIESMRIFTSSTLLGGVSLMPAGVGSTGSLAILQIQGLGLSLTDSVLVVSLMRLLSTGISLAVSGAFLTIEVRSARKAEAGPGHFDEIAAEYLHQFPAHVWSLLLERRVSLLADALSRLPAGSNGLGLDLGCGLGEQATALEKLGYRAVGLDAAHALLNQARQAGVDVMKGDLLELPLSDASVDFVYTVGVLHHLSGRAAQRRAIDEVARVLKPNGLFIVQETNPRNPLFRFYMGYVFPIAKSIDEGTEWWIEPDYWRKLELMTLSELRYFTFLPDFAPRLLLRPLLAIERFLETSALRCYSVHYMATLLKDRLAQPIDVEDHSVAADSAARAS